MIKLPSEGDIRYSFDRTGNWEAKRMMVAESAIVESESQLANRGCRTCVGM